MQCFQLSTAFGGLLPADLDGSTPPPAGSPNYFVAFDDANNNGLNLWKFHVDWANTANSTFTGPTKITTAAFIAGVRRRHLHPPVRHDAELDSLADRLMYRLAYRNFGTHESLGGQPLGDRRRPRPPACAGTSSAAPAGRRRSSRRARFRRTRRHRWMGSIAQDKQGNMLLGYSASSSTVRPGIRYTGRLVTDAPSARCRPRTRSSRAAGRRPAT